MTAQLVFLEYTIEDMRFGLIAALKNLKLCKPSKAVGKKGLKKKHGYDVLQIWIRKRIDFFSQETTLVF